MTGFQPWHAGMIERYTPDGDDPNCALARAILAAACILAEAIDGLTGNVGDIGQTIIDELAEAKKEQHDSP